MSQARVNARENAAIAMADEYERLSNHEAAAAGKKTAALAWKKDKTDLGGDDDKDGIPNAVDKDWKQGSVLQPARTFADGVSTGKRLNPIAEFNRAAKDGDDVNLPT